MAITSEIIGRLGGADVQSFPVEGSIGSNDAATIHTVEVPAGETWLVAVTGDMPLPTTTNSTQQPELRLGQFMSRRVPGTASMGVSAAIAKTTAVTIAANSAATASFTGTVYTVKL